MKSHSVTCHPTQVSIPHLKPSQTGRYSIYLPRRDGRLSWPSWLNCYIPRWFTRLQTVTHPSTNPTQCRLTTLIEVNALTTTLRYSYTIDLPSVAVPSVNRLINTNIHCTHTQPHSPLHRLLSQERSIMLRSCDRSRWRGEWGCVWVQWILLLINLFTASIPYLTRVRVYN